MPVGRCRYLYSHLAPYSGIASLQQACEELAPVQSTGHFKPLTSSQHCSLNKHLIGGRPPAISILRDTRGKVWYLLYWFQVCNLGLQVYTYFCPNFLRPARTEQYGLPPSKRQKLPECVLHQLSASTGSPPEPEDDPDSSDEAPSSNMEVAP